MLSFWIDLPESLQQALIFLLGLVGGTLANYVIYRFAYFNPRRISPWGLPPEDSNRNGFDRIPVVGWLLLRRESNLHGRGFWIRPLLIEAILPFGLLWLYQFEVADRGLWPLQLQKAELLGGYSSMGVDLFFTHALLLVLMTAATFIDFDERTIPDIITIPGTCLGLLAATLSVQVFMPTTLFIEGIPFGGPTTFDSPWSLLKEPTDKALHADQESRKTSLLIALAIWSAWCFALADRRWSSALFRRRGFTRAMKHFINGIFHYGFWKVLLSLWLIGSFSILVIRSIDGPQWQGLLTGLYGLAVGGGVVWLIRIIATWALDVEAMGFGDVTLMAMIGSMIGWQAALIAFFLSPFAAIFIVLGRYVITRDAYTPFGPYLCAGALMTIIGWDRFYRLWLMENLLFLGPLLLWFSFAMLALMAVMLMVWRQIKMRIFASQEEME